MNRIEKHLELCWLCFENKAINFWNFKARNLILQNQDKEKNFLCFAFLRIREMKFSRWENVAKTFWILKVAKTHLKETMLDERLRESLLFFLTLITSRRSWKEMAIVKNKRYQINGLWMVNRLVRIYQFEFKIHKCFSSA